MDYLKILHEKPDLADEFDSLFDFFLLDELSPDQTFQFLCGLRKIRSEEHTSELQSPS